MNDILIKDDIKIEDMIYEIRGKYVMLDSDLAEIYGYETKNFNRQVKNNIEKFDEEDFMFQLNKEEVKELSRCKNFTLNKSSGRGSNIKYLPYAFTEQGIYMLMTVLKGSLVVYQSKVLIRAFKCMRDYLMDNALVFQRLRDIDLHLIEHDENFRKIFNQLENPKEVKAVLFFKGQMWDATSLIEDIIIKAKEEIILIDNYIDKKTLDLLVKKKKGVAVNIYTSEKGNKLTVKEITDFNNQYGLLNIRYTDEFHDRFMILDKKTLYHIGSSIKDAGKKAFEISIIEDEKQLKEILRRLKVN